MDINGCHIVSSLNSDSPDGFSAIASRYVGFYKIPDEIPVDAVKVSKGPFYRQREAIKYALSWTDAEHPPAMKPHDPLDINDCRVSTESSTTAPDGVVSTVTRQITVAGSVPPNSPEGTEASAPTITEVSRGPFNTLKEAVEYAKSWTDITNPPALPNDVSASSSSSSSSSVVETPETDIK